MASLSVIEAEANRLPAAIRTAIVNCFREVLKLRWGRSGHNVRSENFVGGFYESETASVAGTEFSIEHGFGKAPYLLVPVLPLGVGWQLVPLEVTKAPDAKRIYLKSTVESAPVAMYVEA